MNLVDADEKVVLEIPLHGCNDSESKMRSCVETYVGSDGRGVFQGV